MRIHKVGNLDTDPEIAIERQPSFKAMLEFAQSIPKVKQAIVEEKIQQASEDFEDDENWAQKLKLTKKGEIEDTLENLVLILSNDPKLKGLAFNSHRDGIDAKGELPWSQLKCGWSDNDFFMSKSVLS